MENHSIEEDEEINFSSTLPQESSWRVGLNLHKYQGFWCFPDFIKGIILFQKEFKSQPNDILLSSFPKSGTTWLKCLMVAISTRSMFPANSPSNPLLTKVVHELLPVVEFIKSHERDIRNPLMVIHVPIASLPKSILDSNTKIIYVYRDPKDVLVSLWHFSCNEQTEIITFQEAFEKFCNGVCNYGPYWDHLLGYWEASLQFPNRVLFLKYEEMKNDGCFYVKKIADFMGCSFSVNEEKQGIAEKIVELCSFKNMSNLELNNGNVTTKHSPIKIKSNLFSRKGEVGDWKNYFTTEMAEKLDQIIKDKFSGCGLNV